MKKVMLYLAALLFLGMPSLCFGQGYVTGSITTTGATCTPATNCVSIPVPKNYGGASFTISGTYSGTLNFEATGDGTNYSALNVNPVGGGSAVTTTTSTGTWVINISGLVAVRVRASALASGSATVTIQLSIARREASVEVVEVVEILLLPIIKTFSFHQIVMVKRIAIRYMEM